MPKPLTVWITTNWKILKEMGVPDHPTFLLRNLYAGQEATVRTGHGTTDWFQIRKGVCQFSRSVLSNSVTPWNAARQVSPSFTVFWSLLKLVFTESVMLSNNLILCHPFRLLPSIFPRIRVFSNELALCIRWPKYWNFNFSIRSSKECSGFISFRID